MPQTPMFRSHPEDVEFYQREVASFVPQRVFDAHAHVWPASTSATPFPENQAGDLELYTRCAETLFPNRHRGALLIGMPRNVDMAPETNDWTAGQLAKAKKTDPNYRGLFLIRPNDDPEWVRQEVKRLGLCGLKCYHLFTGRQPTWEAELPEYLPERLVNVAGEEGWVITLHMVRSRALADESNLHWIEHYCRTYPDIRLILAHSARGFQPSHNFEGLPKLVGLDNLYFDCSANCESVAHQVILRLFGHRKLLYGSDFPVSHMRGRSVAVCDSFLWLYEDTPVWKGSRADLQPALTGLENLRSLKWACWSERLTDCQVEDIFWNNAAEMFGLSR